MPKPNLLLNPIEVPSNPGLAADMIAATESGITNIRPGNQSELYWSNDSLQDKTAYCLLYLHGFSASPMEGNPVHIDVAKEMGMNVYIPRLAAHGLNVEEALLDMTPDRLWESAKQALAMASALGEKVILMGTSTGGTLALMLAAHYPDDIAALVLYAPNVRLFDKTAFLLDKPWGLQIARLVMGGDYREPEMKPAEIPFWYSKYRIESLVYLQQLITQGMKSVTFEKVTVPVFTGYYFKDEDNQDNTVSVDAIHWMFDNLATDPSKKVEVAFPEAGVHVICSNLVSGAWEDVEQETVKFLKEVL